ncbi:MAG: HAD family hydrolase [Planctomycetes bacterium]|nr:HAD family hydrolase [Planctomycetota bacterium]
MTTEGAQPPTQSAEPPAHRGRPAAFFDVDGTLTKTTILHPYVYFRRAGMSSLMGRVWYAAFLIKCLIYLVLDKIDRNMLNVVFYRSYAGMSVAKTRNLAASCHEAVIKPRQFQEVPACLAEQREAGRIIVLVTGSSDFIIAPLAKEFGATDLIAPSLVEANDRFTGKLTGPPIGGEEKARRVRSYAEARGIDLAQSHAFGDSIADLPMLERVGHPHAVNPDRTLGTVARERGWPVHQWSIGKPVPPVGAPTT